ncbi:conserved hypothetical protein [Agrobacterium tumefaciens str. Kerr 14]|uniref:Conjugal transfer protein TraH n=1 Tax=Agrobacterium tumefaciens str. Kerr 14 TaxID=1183424 RepID=A0A1S7SC62_AGRTU|nr:TraH family protein [Agrobacterium tumefaciens]CUX66444.1 conserved hypothetical protein [Agrobacterium tumefaciens str. Kerr 14]
MVDAALVQQCADPRLKPAIVEQFIAKAGSQDPLAVTVRSGNRVVLVPKPTTPEALLALIRDNLGRNTVRVGITQYPAGLGLVEAGQLKPDMVEPCENIRMGTVLFAKVYRIVAKWYGNPTAQDVLPQVLDDAIIAWRTGYFEGLSVFGGDKPKEVQSARPAPERDTGADDEGTDDRKNDSVGTAEPDPNKAGIRIDLTGMGSKI